MRITCPNCSAIYDVPAEKMAGRTLKCARCGHGWVPVSATPPVVEAPASPDPLPEPAPAVAPIVVPARLAPRAPAPARWPLAAAWAATIVILVIMVLAGVLARQQIMQAWPPSERLYQALGLH